MCGGEGASGVMSRLLKGGSCLAELNSEPRSDSGCYGHSLPLFLEGPSSLPPSSFSH